MATNHLASKSGTTQDLLRQLTDDQLQEQIKYWQVQREAARDRDDMRSAVGYGKELSIAYSISTQRAHS
jgi:hypothetical protein